ncbi:hypothetical protein C4577_07460 [Candidatus Parcubacteria bacterium]|nr:MAG: hypothetical protein C4577_07460 [Candidatus Parcubacteria bacterium]
MKDLIIVSVLTFISITINIILNSKIASLKKQLAKAKEPVQKVAHRLPTPDIDLIRENRRLACLVPRMEKELKFWKQEAQRWMPRQYSNSYIESEITLAEAISWIR